MNDLPPILSDQSAFLAAMDAAGCLVKGRSCTCPFHEDSTPSAQWSQGQDGTWRMYCHVCDRHASTIDLQAHVSGQDPRAAFKAATGGQREGKKPEPVKRTANGPSVDFVLTDRMAVKKYAERLGQVEAWHVYGPKDNPVLVVARIRKPDGKKTFRQFCPVDGGWAPQNLVPRGQIPLYRQDGLGDRVLVVEGEKCADACWGVGIAATTSAMGAGKAKESDWSALAGKRVYVWPDNDDTGRKHMAEVREILEGLGCAVYWIEPEGMGLPVKGDVADLIDALDGKSTNDIAATITGIMDDAEPQGASQELDGLLREMHEGKFVSIPWPGLELIGSLSKALLPGCITTLCAEPGAGKSLLTLQMLAGWHRAGVSVALLALEDERRMHMQRVLAQTAGLSALTDDQWVRENYGRAQSVLDAVRDDIDAIGARIKAEGEDQMKLTDIADWIEQRAKSGCRVIVVDPVTAAVTEREPWAADTAFLMRVKKTARAHACSIILVTHPRGTARGAALGAMAGGSAYPRFSHTALWLEKFDMQERQAVDGNMVTVNRSVRITKSRHGKGGGMLIGCVFHADTLRFGNQCGLCTDDKPAKSSGAHARPPQGARLRQRPNASEDVF
jgi:archaellum biogenesis ATPase FlaH